MIIEKGRNPENKIIDGKLMVVHTRKIKFKNPDRPLSLFPSKGLFPSKTLYPYKEA